MLVKNVVRGNAVTFVSAFYDANNAIFNPTAPTLTVRYKSNNIYVTTTANLVFASNTWSAIWDSSNADVGIVEWHVAGGSGSLVAEDGEFRILANKANGGAGAT